MKMSREISEYYSEDKTKKAVVILHGEDYTIDFFQNEKYNHSIMYSGKSLNYVQDAAENYALGIFKNIKDF
jgi:hypothetical protein